MMSGQTVVGFRDSAYLYYPLFQWIDAQWAAGQIPLWNPYCNFGMPVVGDGTSSVFYPGKLVFFCRFLSYPARYGIYLAIHIPIAGAGAYWCARKLRANRGGAALAAFSYAFGGSVLFNVTNVIYLVSAAWLPFALGAVWLMVKTGQWRWSVAAGVCCALMILGGDPQMVYHVGLIAIATIVGEFFRRKRRRNKNRDRSQTGVYRWAIGASGKLALMIGVTTILAMVQILPTYEWSKQSERTNPKVAANIYGLFDLADEQWRELKSALIGVPQQGLDHAYQFSQPPWTIAELFWPNVSGKLFPIHQRWSDGLPGADRVWVPSLYAGLITILIAIGGFRIWGRRRKQVWLTRVGLFFAVASFGWYGVVWLLNEFLPINRQMTELGPQVGGFYWLMTMFLPKYYAFRYPAKLFVIASLALSLLAGVQLRNFRPWISGKLVILVSLATCVGFLFMLFGLNEEFFRQVPANALFGPFDKAGSRLGILYGLVQVLIVLGAAMLVIKFIDASKRGPAVVCLILILTSVDLSLANRWLLSEISADSFNATIATTDQIVELKSTSSRELNRVGPISVFRNRGENEPLSWSQTISPERLVEVVQWQRETLFPKQHLEYGVRLIGSFASIWPEKYEVLLNSVEYEQFTYHRLSPRYRSLPFEHNCDAEILISERKMSYQAKWNLFGGRPAYVFLILESTQPNSKTGFRFIPVMKNLEAQHSSDSECHLVEFQSDRLRVAATTKRGSWLMHNSIYDGNWYARVRNASGAETIRKMEQFGSYHQGVLLEPGEFEVTIFYRPILFWIGAGISGIGWSVLLFGWQISRIRKIRRSKALQESPFCRSSSFS